MSKKARKNYRVYSSFLVLAIALVVALGVVGVVRANVGGVTEKSVDGLVACLVNNPDHSVCKTLVKVLETILPSEDDVLGGAVTRERVATNIRELGLIDPDTGVVVEEGCRTDTFPKTTSTFFSLQNLTRKDLAINYAAIHVTRAPSATLYLSLGTSTVSSLRFDAMELATETIPNGIFDRYEIATSSQGDLLLTNFRQGVVTGTTGGYLRKLAGSVLGTCAAPTAACPVVRVGRHRDPVVVVQPDQYLIGHIEALTYNLAVTSSATSSPASDTTSRNLQESGDVGLLARTTVCWKAVSTSSPQ